MFIKSESIEASTPQGLAEQVLSQLKQLTKDKQMTPEQISDFESEFYFALFSQVTNPLIKNFILEKIKA